MGTFQLFKSFPASSTSCSILLNYAKPGVVSRMDQLKLESWCKGISRLLYCTEVCTILPNV